MADITRIGGPPPPSSHAEPDAHGQAALLLAESILHALIDTSAITTMQAVAIVQAAQEIKVEVAQLSHESRRRMQHSLELLDRIADSLSTDIV